MSKYNIIEESKEELIDEILYYLIKLICKENKELWRLIKNDK